MIGRRCGDSPPRRGCSSCQRISLKVESLCVVLDVQEREHGPGVGISRCLSHRHFQCRLCGGKIFRSDPLEIAETTQHSLVGTQLLGIAAAHSLTHAPWQHPVHIRNRRDNPRNQLVLQLENRLRTKVAFIVLSPEMSAVRRVDELNCQAQLCSRLSQAALHHVASAEILADGPHVPRLARMLRGRAPGNHSEVGESRQSGNDVFSQPLGQRHEFGIAAAVFEGQHGHPESFLGANRSRWVLRGRMGSIERRGSHSFFRRNLQPRFAETIDQLPDQFRFPPFFEFRTGHDGEIRTNGKQLPRRAARQVQLA